MIYESKDCKLFVAQYRFRNEVEDAIIVIFIETIFMLVGFIFLYVGAYSEGALIIGCEVVCSLYTLSEYTYYKIRFEDAYESYCNIKIDKNKNYVLDHIKSRFRELIN